jgi:DNA-binding transcriptional LysR family regulator
VRPALDQVRAAAAAVGEMADRPRGTIRLHVTPSADHFLSRETLGGFLRRYPEVNLDLIADYSTPDIVAEGYDAGVRLGEVIDQDMVSVPVSGPMRLLVVGSPAYLARHPAPVHPRELTGHACINWRAPGHPPYRWEFEEDGREFSVAVPARVVTNETQIMLRLAMEGIGLALVRENRVRPYLDRGELVSVLEAFSTPFPGFYLYYPQRRQASPALRTLIDHLLELRQRERKRG